MGGLKPVNWIQWLTLMTVLALGIVVPVLVFQLNAVARHQSDALRTVICFSESRVAVSKQLTPQQKKDALTFYSGALASINAKPCK